MKKIYKVIQISALIASTGASFTSITNNNSTAAIAWACCSLWILQLMMAERVLEKTKELLEQMKKQK